jgi:hypothetical protein
MTAQPASGKETNRANNSRRQVDLPLLPINHERANAEWGQKHEERSALSDMLIHCKQIDQRGHHDDTAANAHKTDQNAGAKSDYENQHEMHRASYSRSFHAGTSAA